MSLRYSFCSLEVNIKYVRIIIYLWERSFRFNRFSMLLWLHSNNAVYYRTHKNFASKSFWYRRENCWRITSHKIQLFISSHSFVIASNFPKNRNICEIFIFINNILFNLYFCRKDILFSRSKNEIPLRLNDLFCYCSVL